MAKKKIDFEKWLKNKRPQKKSQMVQTKKERKTIWDERQERIFEIYGEKKLKIKR